MKRFGFTLAEVLITLGIIGIVAVITVPALNNDVEDKKRAEQIRTVKYKFTKATDTMKSLGLITVYESTEDFVNELSNHLKLLKVCDEGHLSDCWPYEKITLSDGTQFNVNNVVDGTTFLRTEGDWSYSPMGIVMADGTSMILTYQKDCAPLESTTSYQWTMIDGKPETNATTDCISGIYEINGKAGKNQFKEDVIPFNANAFAGDCAVGIGVASKCFSTPFQPSVPLSKAECLSRQTELGIGACSDNDYWGAAVAQCGGVKYMPTSTDLMNLGKKLYKNQKYDYSSFVAKSLNLEPSFIIWAQESRGASGTGNYESHRAGGVQYTSTSYSYGWGFGRLAMNYNGVPYYALCIAH